ncbi:MAG: NAD(P)/FAD-dependent oxidoreductase [Gemmatimonadales bacterium]|nr:MAG: NAD(P)/FAD-dependent oxidoreductase [Gemmatimonadales bacterium]
MKVKEHVVVVGAGFAGLAVAQRLQGKGMKVTLLDRQNYHTFLPLLYQVAAAELGPTEIAYPVRSILRTNRDVEFRMGSLKSVDPETRVVVTDREQIVYDHLVLAMGATTNYFGVEGAREHAFPLRRMEEAVPLRHHILSRFEKAVHARDPEERRRLLTFTVVGGGPTGVEFSGALAELVHGPLRRDYPMLDLHRDGDGARIVLLEAMDQVLGGMPEELSDYALERLTERGVEVRLDAAVSRVEADRVVLQDGDDLPTSTVIWTAGVQGEPGPERWGLPMGRQGRVRVRPTLQVEGFDRIWVAGDLAWLEDDEGRPLPGVAPVALQQGSHVARNLARITQGTPLEAFRYRDPGMLAVVGRNAAVAHVGGRSIQGFPAWVLWLVIHVAKLIGFRNRLLVLVNWAWNYLFFRRAVRLILPYAKEPVGEEKVSSPR